jgi:hypothetical protein
MDDDISSRFFCFDPEPVSKNDKKDNIIFSKGTHFIHKVSFNKRGTKKESFLPIGNNVPQSLKGKNFQSPFHYQKAKERLDARIRDSIRMKIYLENL